MVDDKIVDKYWLCCNKDGSIWLTQGRKPVPSDLMGGTWRRIHKTYDDMGWLVLNRGNYPLGRREKKSLLRILPI